MSGIEVDRYLELSGHHGEKFLVYIFALRIGENIGMGEGIGREVPQIPRHTSIIGHVLSDTQI